MNEDDYVDSVEAIGLICKEYDKRAISRKQALRGIAAILFEEIQAIMDDEDQGKDN